MRRSSSSRGGGSSSSQTSASQTARMRLSPSSGICRATNTRGRAPSATPKSFHQRPDATERLEKIGARVRVAHPDVVVAEPAERRTRKDADAHILEQSLGKIVALQPGARDRRERVKRTKRSPAFDARDRVEAVHD